MSRSAASRQGLHCLPMSNIKHTRRIWALASTVLLMRITNTILTIDGCSANTPASNLGYFAP